jgi:electron transport complex protein RnfE
VLFETSFPKLCERRACILVGGFRAQKLLKTIRRNSVFRIFTAGLWRENPVLVSVFGLCPVLATTTSLTNAFGMGMVTAFVMVFSNLIISIFRSYFPHYIRIPCYIVVIASFVTLVDLLVKAYLPALSASLGVFIPLIVVNCIPLARADCFANKNGPIDSALDGLGGGLGFTLALCIVGAVREITGSGAIGDIPLTSLFGGSGAHFQTPAAMIMAPGAFLVIGFVMAFLSWRKGKTIEQATYASLKAQLEPEFAQPKEPSAPASKPATTDNNPTGQDNK